MTTRPSCPNDPAGCCRPREIQNDRTLSRARWTRAADSNWLVVHLKRVGYSYTLNCITSKMVNFVNLLDILALLMLLRNGMAESRPMPCRKYWRLTARRSALSFSTDTTLSSSRNGEFTIRRGVFRLLSWNALYSFFDSAYDALFFPHAISASTLQFISTHFKIQIN